MAEPIRIMLGIAPYHGDEGEHEQYQDQQDLAAGQPELGFSVASDHKKV